MLLLICLHIPFCISFNPTLPKPFRDRKQEGASVDWALVWEDPHKSRSVQGTQGEGHLGLRADLKQKYITKRKNKIPNVIQPLPVSSKIKNNAYRKACIG